MQYNEENKLHKSNSKPYFSFADINAQDNAKDQKLRN